MKKTGQILIKLVLNLTTFLLIGMIHLKLVKKNIDYSTEAFLNKIKNLLDCYAPFKKNSKYKLKSKIKPWLTPSLH